MKFGSPPSLPKVPNLGLPSLRKFKPLSIRLPLHQRVANLLATGHLSNKGIGIK